MRLAAPIQTTGLFWLPENQDEQLPGVLRISESGEAALELTGVFGDPLSTLQELGFEIDLPLSEKGPNTSRVVGRVEHGGLVTLDRCIHQVERLSLSGGISKSIIHPQHVFIGAAFDGEEEIQFEELSFSVEGLDLWLSISGFRTEPDAKGKGVSINYRQPDNISVGLPSDVQAEFIFGWSSPGVNFPVTEVSVKQTSYVYLTTKEPHPFEDFSSLVLKLCRFLSLAVDETVSIQSITGYIAREVGIDQTQRVSVQVYGQFAPWTDRRPALRPHNMLFQYSNVADRLDQMLTKWLESYETFEPAFYLYFASRADTFQYLDTRVLWLTQALETLHRRSSREKEMPKAKFKRLLESIDGVCPEDDRKWLADKLHYANELSFRKRIEMMIEPFKNWFGSGNTRKAFVNKVCATRNYLTHYDASLKRQAAKGGSDLSNLRYRLEALMQLHLLRIVGLDRETIDSIVQRNERLRTKLRV